MNTFYNKLLQMWCCLTDAVKQKFPDVADKLIRERIGSFLAQAGDREGGRKSRLSSAAQQRSMVASGEANDDETDPGSGNVD